MSRKTPLLNRGKEATPAGQAALEYLLLLGGGALVALIAFLILLFFGPFGGGIINEHIDEYEKIDLCAASGSPATCSFFMNWTKGLSAAPLGVALDNQSNWRTLVVDGVKIELWCDGVLCDLEDNFGGNLPVVQMEFPITDTSPLNCSPTGTPCPPCNPKTETCKQLDLPACFGASGTCEKLYDNSDLQFAFTLSPNDGASADWSKDIVVGLLLPPVNELSKVDFKFNVSQLDGSSFSYTGLDDGSPIFWYNSWPNFNGSAYQCNNSGGILWGCSYAPGCTPKKCSTLSVPPAACASSSSICVPPSGELSEATPISCTNDASVGPYTISSTNWPAFHFDATPLSSATTFFEGVPAGLYIEMEDFTTASSCINTGDCYDDCGIIYQAQVSSFQLVKFDSASITNDVQMCGAFTSTSTTTIPFASADVELNGTWDEITLTRHCSASISLVPALLSLFSIDPSGQFYLGVKGTGSPVKVHSIYQPPGDSKSPVRLGALFVPK